MDKKLEARIARLERLVSNSNCKPTLEQRIARLEKMIRNEVRAPKTASDAIVDAVYKGNLKKVMQLLDAGTDPNEQNKYGMSPLAGAVNCHNTDIAKVLLDAGADPNEITSGIGVDWYGDGEDVESDQSLLELAEWDDDDNMVALLKQYGAR